MAGLCVNSMHDTRARASNPQPQLPNRATETLDPRRFAGRCVRARGFGTGVAGAEQSSRACCTAHHHRGTHHHDTHTHAHMRSTQRRNPTSSDISQSPPPLSLPLARSLALSLARTPLAPRHGRCPPRRFLCTSNTLTQGDGVHFGRNPSLFRGVYVFTEFLYVARVSIVGGSMPLVESMRMMDWLSSFMSDFDARHWLQEHVGHAACCARREAVPDQLVRRQPDSLRHHPE
eukprot:3933806-Rhodomonas_salina.4